MMKISDILRPTPHPRRRKSRQHISSERTYTTRSRALAHHPSQRPPNTSAPRSNEMGTILAQRPHTAHHYNPQRSPSNSLSPSLSNRHIGQVNLPSMREMMDSKGIMISPGRDTGEYISKMLVSIDAAILISYPELFYSICKSLLHHLNFSQSGSSSSRQASLPPVEPTRTDPSLHSKASNSPSAGNARPARLSHNYPAINTNIDRNSHPFPPSSYPGYPSSPTGNSTYSYPSPGSPTYQRHLPTSVPTSAPGSYNPSHTASPIDPTFMTRPGSGTATPPGGYGPPLLPSGNLGTDSPPPSHHHHHHHALHLQQQGPGHHHHYIAPNSSAAQFAAAQSQDRYVCPTCTKAFSRPSSLKIHTHSHTGEKPFRCPHASCGKAFSVRSNMKRHERGCHGGESPTSSTGH